MLEVSFPDHYRIQKPSQGQLRLMYGRIISKNHAIEAMIDAVRQSDLTSEVEGSK